MNYKGCKDDVAGGITKILWTASQLEERSDFDDLLEAILILRPQWHGAGTVVAWRYLRRQSWLDALRVLEADSVEAKRSALHAALMAVCLFGMQDPLWQSYARSAAEQNDNVEASSIGNRLLERAAKWDASVYPLGPRQASANGSDDFVNSTNWVRA